MRLIGAVLLCCLLARAVAAAEPAERQREFDIGAQSLASALLQFSGQSGVQILAADARLAERQVRGVRGRMAPAAALQMLLAGTGLTFRYVDEGTIALVRPAARAPERTDPPAPALTTDETVPDSGVPSDTSGLTLLEEVQVTGTRIQVPGNYSAANPITTITSDEMRHLGYVNVGDATTLLVPQNIPSYQPALTGDDQEGSIQRGAFFVGNTIANLRGMDPTFGTRTLTMIDGRRVVSTSNQADVVDMSVVPSNLLQRVDVVTGGASATYGSGAMAGVMNLVLRNRLNGIHADLDYGFNAAGDGGSAHAALSGGLPLFGGRGHALLGMEWQDQAAIRDCAAARDWCAMSRTLYHNFSGTGSDAGDVLVPLAGFEERPARFMVADHRYSQFAPTGTIYSSSADNTSGLRFTEDGSGIEEYAYGYRGGTGRSTMGGDGPLTAAGVPLRPDNQRRTVFANMEYDFTSQLAGYLQGSHARTDSRNRNRHTQGTACLRFNQAGVAAVPGGSAQAGEFIAYGGNGEAFTDPFTGAAVADFPRHPLWSNVNFRTLLAAPAGRTPPYFIRPGQNGSTDTTPPSWNFPNAVNPVWQRIRSAQGTDYWNLVGVTLAVDFADPGAPAVLPALGRNAYAFLGQLSPEALHQVQRSFGNSSSAGSGPGLDNLFGGMPCSGHTAIRKVWNPQIQQWTSHESATLRAVAGLKGGFGRDWRWEAYYQYGRTESTSIQNNVQTNLSFAFAMDAVIDDRTFIDGVANPGFGQPVCRILRDGIPVVDATGRPTSDPEGLAALAADCRPLNIFGTRFADPAAAQLQREALAYAFKDNISDGANSLQVLSFTTSGTLGQGWAGPVTGAFGVEIREDEVDNEGSRGPFYLRADIARAWGDAFGGSTRVTEGYTELNLPVISGLAGMNLLSTNAALRYASYHNKGGAGTTRQSATQDTLNWKFQAVVEPFHFVRLRLTRSRDLRAAGYRDLFLNQPGVPDSIGGQEARNPWRDRTADSQENQYERWGTVSVGNPDLKPEKSDTLTLGLVLSPGGRARDMRFSADYYNIRVKDGIFTSYSFAAPVLSCWENSGNVEPRYVDGQAVPGQPGINGLHDADLPECREISFALHEDGTRNLHDIISYNANRPSNGLPYQRRGVDLAWNYLLPLERLFARLPGQLSLTVRATRALESSGIQQLCVRNSALECEDGFSHVDQVGQIRSSVFIPGVTATPKWLGNFIGSWRSGALTTTLSARYVGGAKLDNTWADGSQDANFRDATGLYLYGSVDRNRVDPYLNFSLNGSYDLRVPGVKQLQVFGSINNLFDKSPPFTGGGIGGASAQFHDTLGRAFRAGVRMQF